MTIKRADVNTPGICHCDCSKYNIKPTKPYVNPKKCQCKRYCTSDSADMFFFPLLFGRHKKRKHCNKKHVNKVSPRGAPGVNVKGRQCSREHGTCRCNGWVRYGTYYHNNYSKLTAWRKVHGSIGCNNGVWGDPHFGTRKTCYCYNFPKPTPKPAPKPAPKPIIVGGMPSASVKGYRCSGEHHTCKCNGWVRYGTYYKNNYTKLTAWRKVHGSIGCNNGVFGDPHFGTVKSCYC